MHRWIRSPSSARASLAVGLILQLVLVGPVALAEKASASARSASRAVFLRAQEDYAAGRYAVALAGYEEAHRLFPMPAFIFNMAQCQRLLQRPEQALALYRRYLTEEPAAKNRKTVEDFITELEAAVAALPPKAPVRLVPDGPTQASPQPIAALSPSPAPAAAPLHQQWWFWTGVAVVVGGVATGVALASSGPSRPPTSLGDVDLR